MYFFDLENLLSVTICENHKAIIACEVGGNIKVVEASYGRHNGQLCRHPLISNQNCNAGNSLSVVQGACDNRASCELNSSNSVFGDPCYGTYKYLHVKYYCSP